MSATKSLPRDPTPAMIEAAERVYFRGYGWTDEEWAHYLKTASAAERAVTHEILTKIIVAAHDAAPSSLPLKRTDHPCEPGWYWGRSNRLKDNPQIQPLIVLPSRIHGCLVTGTYHLGACMLHEFDWFGPLALPETEGQPA